jgi:hypothetical protein
MKRALRQNSPGEKGGRPSFLAESQGGLILLKKKSAPHSSAHPGRKFCTFFYLFFTILFSQPAWDFAPSFGSSHGSSELNGDPTPWDEPSPPFGESLPPQKSSGEIPSPAPLGMSLGVGFVPESLVTGGTQWPVTFYQTEYLLQIHTGYGRFISPDFKGIHIYSEVWQSSLGIHTPPLYGLRLINQMVARVYRLKYTERETGQSPQGQKVLSQSQLFWSVGLGQIWQPTTHFGISLDYINILFPLARSQISRSLRRSFAFEKNEKIGDDHFEQLTSGPKLQFGTVGVWVYF